MSRNKAIIALATLLCVVSGTALAQGTTEATATAITNLPATFKVPIDGFAETASSDVCDEGSSHSFFYKYTTGGSQESVTFFAIGEDTEFVMYVEGETITETCIGGDFDDNPSFASLGLTEPAIFDGVDTSNSEIFTETLSANTTYILQIGLNDPLESGMLACIVFGMFDSQGQAAAITDLGECSFVPGPLQLDNVVTGAAGGGVVFGGIIPEDGQTVPDAPSVVANSGMLDAPAYYSRLEQRHFNMTYNTGDQIPLSFALGIGTGGDFWHRNTEMVVSQIDNSRPADEALVGALSGGATSTGFTVTRTAGANSRGPGTLEAVGELVFDGGSTLEVTHTYEVVENTNFVKATTSIRSTSGTVPNVNMWVGTSDDWVGVTDSPTSSLGLVTGEGVNATFAAKCNGPTNAVLVQSDAEFLMLYSPNISYAQAVLSALIEVFDSVINVAPEDLSNWVYESEWVEGQPEFEHNTSIVDQNPKASAYGIETNDGAHALALKYGDVGTTPVSRTWYYQAGILPDVPFDVCPNPQQQIFGVYTEGPEMVPVNSLGGLLVLITMVLGVAVFVVRGRM